MRIDGYYNREPIGLSDDPEEAYTSMCDYFFSIQLSNSQEFA